MPQGGSAAPAGDGKKDCSFAANIDIEVRAGLAPRETDLEGNVATVRERFCSCRDLLLRCPAETREHRRSPDSVRKGWSQIQVYSELEYRMADRLWSSALPAKPRPLAARFLPLSPVEEAVGSDCRVVLSPLLARLDNAPRDGALAAHYPRMR